MKLKGEVMEVGDPVPGGPAVKDELHVKAENKAELKTAAPVGVTDLTTGRPQFEASSRGGGVARPVAACSPDGGVVLLSSRDIGESNDTGVFPEVQVSVKMQRVGMDSTPGSDTDKRARLLEKLRRRKSVRHGAENAS